MGNLKNYIRLSIRNLAKQQERRIAKEEQGEKLDAKLIDIFNKFKDGDYTVEEYAELATDIMMANIFNESFFKELSLREDEQIAESEMYAKLSVEEIQELRPIDIAKLTKDYIEKKGLFENE